MDDREYDQQIDPLTVPGVSNMGLGGGQMPGSFGTTGRGPRLLAGGGPRATAISTASTRSGNSTGLLDCRTSAITRATMRISNSAARNSRMVSQMASPTE